MADTFDPYREALVTEQITVWPEAYGDLDYEERYRLEALLHAEPEAITELEYVRTHTGFSRQITVTDEDLARVRQAG